MAFLQSPSSIVEPMLPLVFLSCVLLSMCFFFVLLYKRFRRVKGDEDESTHNQFSICRCSLSSTINKIHQSNKAHQLFVEFFTSDSPKLVSLCAPICSDCNEGGNGVVCNEGVSDGSELDKEGGDDDCRKSGELGGKKKKKKGKKKRHVDDGGYDPGVEISKAAASQHDKHQCIDCSYPFTSSSSITQRKIKQQYDQLMKSNDYKCIQFGFGEIVTSFKTICGIMEKRESTNNECWIAIQETPGLNNGAQFFALSFLNTKTKQYTFLKMSPDQRLDWITWAQRDA